MTESAIPATLRYNFHLAVQITQDAWFVGTLSVDGGRHPALPLAGILIPREIKIELFVFIKRLLFICHREEGSDEAIS
jgi:hypothetical protein